MMDRQRLITLLDELMYTRQRASLFAELAEAMEESKITSLSEFLLTKLILPVQRSPVSGVRINPASWGLVQDFTERHFNRPYTLREEAERMYRSGCGFNWHPRPDLCLEFLGPNGGIWGMTYEQLSGPQKNFYKSLRAGYRRWEQQNS